MSWEEAYLLPILMRNRNSLISAIFGGWHVPASPMNHALLQWLKCSGGTARAGSLRAAACIHAEMGCGRMPHDDIAEMSLTAIEVIGY